jgi:endonuclease YncB( thermonuclease family)
MRLADSLFLALAACGAFGMHCLASGHPAPQPSWVTMAKVVRVIDGDTLDVEVRRVIRVRLLDCWAPESKQDPRLPEERRQAEKAKGQASKASLAKLADGKTVTVQIPVDADGDISKSMTMGRVLGHVWLASDPSETLSEKQVRNGHATIEKPEALK